VNPTSDTTLYDLLAVPAPDGAATVETLITRRKETLDDDAEDLPDDDVIYTRGG
jgi:hypothetical protein